jgi:hypothetical protein
VRRLALIVAVLMLTACSPKLLIMHNGMPQPDNTVLLENDSSGIRVAFNFRKIVEDSEESLSTEYLDFNKKTYISKDTKAVVLDLWVYNPKGHKYQVNKVVEIHGRKHSKTEKIIYKGRELTKRFQLSGPVIEGKEVRLGAFVRIGKLPLFFAGDAWYKVRKEVSQEYFDDYRQ